MPNAYNQFPPGALDWLIGPLAVRILTCTSSMATPRALARTGHSVLALLPPVTGDVDRGLRATTNLVHLAGDINALPIADCSVDIVYTNLPSSDLRGALSGFTRVVNPGGWVASTQLVRDDSVPWVRRLVEFMHSYDPSSMRGGSPDAQDLLSDSKYFPETMVKEFRVWVPMTHSALAQLLLNQPFVGQLGEHERTRFLTQAASIYESAGQSLRLPYSLTCVRAQVDHAELTIPIQLTEEGLTIPL